MATSAFATKRTFKPRGQMSALRGKDIGACPEDVTQTGHWQPLRRLRCRCWLRTNVHQHGEGGPAARIGELAASPNHDKGGSASWLRQVYRFSCPRLRPRGEYHGRQRERCDQLQEIWWPTERWKHVTDRSTCGRESVSGLSGHTSTLRPCRILTQSGRDSTSRSCPLCGSYRHRRRLRVNLLQVKGRSS